MTSTARAYVFPGQGSQHVGMGGALAGAFACARHLYQEVDDALSQHLFKLMQEGPEDRLTLTENAQPALMAVSMAVVRVLEVEGGIRLDDTASHVAGHSLGEYSALCAAGALDLATTARLLKTRGRAMQAAVPVGQGGMAALLGLDFDAAVQVAAEAAQGQVCAAANDNAPGQVVVSGHLAAVERALELARAAGAKRALMLPVSAPFHCSLMQPAADAMEKALAGAPMQAPLLPVVANVTARPVADPGAIKDLLVRQVTGTVRWRESVLNMKADGVAELVELGAGKVLSGLARRIDGDLTGRSLGDPQGIESYLSEIK